MILSLLKNGAQVFFVILIKKMLFFSIANRGAWAYIILEGKIF